VGYAGKLWPVSRKGGYLHMSNKSLTLHVSDNLTYDYCVGKRKYRGIVIPVYKDNGENLCDILTRLVCGKDDSDHNTA